MQYEVIVNKASKEATTYTVDYQEDTLKVDDQVLAWDLIQEDEGSFHILHQKQSYQVEIMSANYAEKTFRIRVNNQDFDLKMVDPMDKLLNQLGMQVRSNVVKEIKAPMPGLIHDILVNPGQAVKKGDSLLILEAMKMENIIKSPGDAEVKAVLVKQGENVEKNNILIQFA